MTPKSTKSDSASKSASKKSPSFAELFAKTEAKVPSLKRNQEVSGKIVSVTPGEILVDIGAKSEGILAGRELAGASDIVANLFVGDTINATILYPENDAGQVVLSLRKISQDAKWQELEEKKNLNEDVKVTAIEANRGGLICEFNGIRGFLPASQLIKTSSKLANLIGKNLSARVIEVDRNSNRLILTQREPDKKDIKEITKYLAKIKIGDKLPGFVTAVLPFGVFVEVYIGQVGNLAGRSVGKNEPTSLQTREPTDLAKLEGLVHVSEIAWEKVEEPAKFFNVGDKVEVMVVAKEEATGRLNLSIKQLSEDPFIKVSEEYSKDREVKGAISRVTPYGVIVKLSKGIEGLIHISKIPPNVSYEVGQEIECSVESVDAKSRKIALVPIAHEKPVLYR